ncbi:VOC family protein [uncultured Dysgonomonas sp.]|uniref:VOC family protein n=1 Tax=uncultured Dysgonomonas sp. TaxID=206096 RepID=UPI0035A70711
MNRINIITLGVKDVKASCAFYKKLGFATPNTEDNPAIVFFNNGGTKLALYPLKMLAEDIDSSATHTVLGIYIGIQCKIEGRSRCYLC